ncbi:flavin monooxygenase-like protein [Cladorrhinum sp. PSN259]|nr:flavin monooxygenase-like protein [Cladorrhinum sp. PSN259]
MADLSMNMQSASMSGTSATSTIVGDVKVAVIGLGPAGLTAIKALREQGFDVQGFERRGCVGGVWSNSHNHSYTSVIQETVANVSKFTSSFSDFPVPRDWPSYLTGSHVAQFLQAYASKFQLHQHIQFNTTVRVVLRDDADAGWNIHIVKEGEEEEEVLHFDKVVLATGSDTLPVWPQMPGRNEFQGTVIHGQSYREPTKFARQRVLVVGLGNTACEVALSVAREASCVYQSYRRGRIIISRYDDDGVPTDIEPWPKTQLKYLLRHRLPWLATWLEKRRIVKTMLSDAARHQAGEAGEAGDSERRRRLRAEEQIRGEWRLLPCPTELVHPAVQDDFISALYSRRITPVRGFKAFVGADKVLLDDGSTVQVDTVVFCTGYALDFGIMPELEMDGSCGLPLRTAADQHHAKAQAGEPTAAVGATSEVPTLPRLYQMLFPPRWASSVAVLSWMSALETAWCVCELASMALSQVWAADAASKLTPGLLPAGSSASSKANRLHPRLAQLPTEAEMNVAVDRYHAWWRRGWVKESSAHPGLIKPYSFYRFLHQAAGTGMYEHVGHSLSLRNWILWWKDRRLHRYLTKGPASSHAWRVFETNPGGIPGCGRRTWPGARQALQDAYEDYEHERYRHAEAVE